MSIHERLRHARTRMALTGAKVDELTGIGPSTLSDFERGKRQPNLNQLQTLARLYQRSLTFFLDTGPLPNETVLWRERPTAAPTVEAEFLRLCQQYHNLEVWCRDRTRTSLPQADADRNSLGYPFAETLAKKIRDDLQLGDRPGPLLLRVLEEVCGVKVFHMAFEPTGTAATTQNDSFGSAILLNAGNRRWRRNFDLAHELFHLLTWRVFRVGDDSGASTPSADEEKFANCFASALLMPTDAIKTALSQQTRNHKVPFEALFDIAREFDVSVEALLWRMHHLCGSDPEHTKRYVERARELGPMLEERDDTTLSRWPARYLSLAVKALRHGEMSIGRFAEYLDIGRHEAMQYIAQEVSDGEEVDLPPA